MTSPLIPLKRSQSFIFTLRSLLHEARGAAKAQQLDPAWPAAVTTALRHLDDTAIQIANIVTALELHEPLPRH